jgi:DNA-binding protein HU-beta
MNKTQLVEALAEKLGDKRTAASAVDGVLDIITETVGSGGSVTLTGFGVFEARARAARVARNPRTGETVPVPATTVPAFRPGTAFKSTVSGGGTPAPAKKAPARRSTTSRSTAARPATRAARSTASFSEEKPAATKAPAKKKPAAAKAAPAKTAAAKTTAAKPAATKTAAAEKPAAKKAPVKKAAAPKKAAKKK